MIAAALVAAVLTVLPATPAQFDGVVMGKSHEGAHPEWSWSKGFVEIPDCYMLKIAKPWDVFTTWICVTPDAYAATPWMSRYSGPGVPYEGSKL